MGTFGMNAEKSQRPVTDINKVAVHAFDGGTMIKRNRSLQHQPQKMGIQKLHSSHLRSILPPFIQFCYELFRLIQEPARSKTTIVPETVCDSLNHQKGDPAFFGEVIAQAKLSGTIHINSEN